MADIRVNSTGKIFWGIDNGVALLLQEAFPEAFSHAGRVQTVNAKPDLTPHYFVGVTSSVTGAMAIVRRVCNTSEFYAGPPEKVTAQWPDCPPEIIKQWAAVDARQRAR